jgi:sec-independent protein translocase protein TatA
MGLSFPHILLLVLVVVLLFGGGRISGVMGDVAKGIKSFKKGMSDDDEAPASKAAPLIEKSGTVVDATDKQTDKQA